uniref:Lon N-terminal domain-containing protein n=2 Tax=Oryza punctata TaxID=4537 RepID=A0A0E0KEY0_ORYPU
MGMTQLAKLIIRLKIKGENLITYMALKTLQVPSSFARPINRSIIGSSSSSQHCLRPKPASAGLAARVAGERRRWRRSTVECRGGSNLHGCECVDEGAVAAPRHQEQAAEIPIVLFPSVVFPGATVQLQAFEFRYRIMVHTLLQEGLTRFGVVYSGGGGGGDGVDGVATGEVGCVAHVVECERLVDGRFFLTCVGGDRFRVVGTVRTKPYVVARIQPLTDDAPSGGGGGDMVRHLLERVEEHLKNVAALSDKLGWSRQPPPLFRVTCSPSSLSFAVAREVVEDREEQQALLRLDDAAARLAREGRYLERRSRYLAAIAAIKDALGGHLYCDDK